MNAHRRVGLLLCVAVLGGTLISGTTCHAQVVAATFQGLLSPYPSFPEGPYTEVLTTPGEKDFNFVDPLLGASMGQVALTAGFLPRASIACQSLGNWMYARATFTYAFRPVVKSTVVPPLGTRVPVTIRGSISASAYGLVWSFADPPVPVYGPSAYGTITYHAPDNPYDRLLAVGVEPQDNPSETRSFFVVRSLTVEQTGSIQIYANGWSSGDPFLHYQPNGFEFHADPLIGIDPTATVLVEGVEYLARDVYDLQMSGYFLPCDGDYCVWANRSGGSFEEGSNWHTWDGSSVPPAGADVEFNLPFDDGTPFTVTLGADHVTRNFLVHGEKMTLDLGGFTLLSQAQVEVGGSRIATGVPATAIATELEIRNGTFQSEGPLNLVEYAPFLATTLRIGPDAVVSCPTLDLKPLVPGAQQRIATLIIDGGSLTAGEINPQGPYLDVKLNSGHLRVTGGYLSLASDTTYWLGDGLSPATLTFEGDNLYFGRGLQIRNHGSLVFGGRSLYMASLTVDEGGRLVWESGSLGCGGPLEIGPAAIGPTVILEQNALSASELAIEAGGEVLLRGGTLYLTGSCEKRPGGVWEYSSGVIRVADLEIGPDGLTGPDGDTTVSLSNQQDVIGPRYESLAQVHVSDGYRLAVSAGQFSTAQLVVDGVFDYGGPTPDDPGRGRLRIGPGNLRIGGGSGDAVLNGRPTVIVDPEGMIQVRSAEGTYGVLTIDPGYTLRLQGSLESPVQVEATAVYVLGDLVLEGGGAFAEGVNVEPGGRLLGSGTILAPLYNAGTISPGASPGVLYVQDSYFQNPSGKLVMEIASSTEFDQLIVSNQAQLAGTLEIVLRDGYMPGITDAFELISAWDLTGRFDDVVVQGGDLRVAYSSTGFVVSAVPEPSAWLLAAMGGLCLIGYWVRRRSGPRR